jgi:hypothetical protein
VSAEGVNPISRRRLAGLIVYSDLGGPEFR